MATRSTDRASEALRTLDGTTGGIEGLVRKVAQTGLDNYPAASLAKGEAFWYSRHPFRSERPAGISGAPVRVDQTRRPGDRKWEDLPPYERIASGVLRGTPCLMLFNLYPLVPWQFVLS